MVEIRVRKWLWEFSDLDTMLVKWETLVKARMLLG